LARYLFRAPMSMLARISPYSPPILGEGSDIIYENKPRRQRRERIHGTLLGIGNQCPSSDRGNLQATQICNLKGCSGKVGNSRSAKQNLLNTKFF
jgi:hypothetical protein